MFYSQKYITMLPFKTNKNTHSHNYPKLTNIKTESGQVFPARDRIIHFKICLHAPSTFFLYLSPRCATFPINS